MSVSSNDQCHLSTQAIRVLIVDDAKLSQHVIQQRLIDAHYSQVKCVDNPDTVSQHIEVDAPHIIILDWMMPAIDGLSLTKMIRAQDKIKNTYTYVLMITGKDSQKAMMQAFQVGVDDFIGKADVACQLIPRMLRAHKTLADWHEQQALVTTLQGHLLQQKQFITIDPLSNLPTQTGFQAQFLKSLETASGRNKGMSCMLVIISNYEQLRTTVQPLAMQKIIRMFVDRLTKYIRPNDYIARVSAQEFAILFLHDKNKEISTLDRIERGLHQMSLKTKEGFHTIEVRSANTTILADTFSEIWNDKEVRQFLSQVAFQQWPLVNRLHQEWPETALNKDRSLEDILYTNEQ